MYRALTILGVLGLVLAHQSAEARDPLVVRTHQLGLDTLLLDSATNHVLVVTQDPFCSACLTRIDAYLDSVLIEGRSYNVILVGSDSRSFAQRRMPDLRRLVRDPSRLRVASMSSLYRATSLA
jgi:hypothetical protein